MLKTETEELGNIDFANEVYSVVNLDQDRVKFRQSVLQGLWVWENFDTCQRHSFVPPKKQFRSEHVTIMIVTKGTGMVNLNMKDYQVKKDNLILFLPQTLMDIGSEKQEFTLSGVKFTFDFLLEIGRQDRMSELLSYFSLRNDLVWDLEPEDTALIEQQIHNLAQRVKKYSVHPFGKEILINDFQIFLFEVGALAQKYATLTRLNFSRQESLVMKFSSLARQQFMELRTVKEYADQLNVTAKYLTEVVKEFSGKNASEIINDLVILEAKFLLKKSELSIGEIADTLSFSDQSFFGKYFKRHTGQSPKAFRKTNF